MSGFILCKEKDGGHTLVPDFFVDNYMPEADGEYVKIYLYLLRCLKSGTQELSVSLIADRFDHTENYICRALRYWEKMKLLQLEYDSADQLTGVRMLEAPQESPDSGEKAEPPAKEASSRAYPGRSPVAPGSPAAAFHLRAVSRKDLKLPGGSADSRSA